MNGLKLFFISLCMSFLCFIAQAQKISDIEKDFTQISIFADQADYKGGYFYSKKVISALKRKEKNNEIDLLRANCFLALFSDKLDKTDETDVVLKNIQSLLPALTNEKYINKIARAFEAYCEFYHQRGMYETTDSVYQIIHANTSLLLPYDNQLISYYHNVALYKKGYLNEVTASVNQNVSRVASMLIKDSVYKANALIYSELGANEKMLRQNLWAKYILLKGKIYLENGFSDSTISYVKNQISSIKEEMHNREGYKAQLYYLNGLAYLDNNEFALSENALKTAFALAQRYFQPQAPIQISIENALVTALLNQHKTEEAAYYKNDAAVRIYSYFNKNGLAYSSNRFSDITNEINNQNWAGAEKMLKDFLIQPILPRVHYLRAKYLTVLFEVLIQEQKYTEAETILTQRLSLQAALTGKTSPACAIILLDKAALYSFNLNRFDEAKAIYSKVLDTDLKDKISCSHPAYIKSSINFSDLYIFTEEFDLSAKRLEKNLKEVETSVGKQHPLYAIYLTQSGDLKTILGDYKSAEASLTTSVDIFAQANKKKYIRDYIFALEMNIKLYVLEGNYSSADAFLKTIKKAAAQGNISDEDDLFLVEEIGLLFTRKGEYQKANKLLTNILKRKTQLYGENDKSICNTLNYLGELNLITGDYTDADTYFARSLQINKTAFGEKSVPYATSLLFYKQLYTAIGDYDKAETSIKDALAIYAKKYGENNIKTGTLLHQYALATFEADEYTNRKNKSTYKSIEDSFIRSLKIINDNASDKSILYAEALEDFSIFYAQTNQHAKALGNIEQAKNIWSSNVGALNVHNAQLDYLSGKIYYRSAQYSNALGFFQKSGEQYKNIFDDEHPGYISALGSSAQMYYILGNNAKAIENIEECTNKSLLYLDQVFPFLSERGKVAYWDKIKVDFEFYKTIAFTNSTSNPVMIEKVLNIQLQTKSLLLNSLLKIKNRIYASGDTTSIRLYQNWQDARDELSIAYSMSAAQRKENGVDIPLLESSLESIEKQLSSISEDFVESKSKSSHLYNWKKLKESLQENEIAIETIPFRLYTKSFSDTIWYAFVAINHTSKNPEYVIEKNGAELETRHLKYYRNLIKFEQEDNASYSQFWKPITTLISEKYTSIYFAGDGVYNQINLETLRNENGEFLINSKNIVCIGTCRDIIDRSLMSTKNSTLKKTTPTITLVGNPTYYSVTPSDEQTVDQLPGSEEEVVKIDSLLTKNNWISTLYLEKSATEDTVKTIYSPTVFHISTHGFFWTENKESNSTDITEQIATNPLLKSGVLLYNGGELLTTDNINTINKTDGILTAYEAMNLSLDKTELVVLSACETGLGEVKTGEGVYGLQRSFTVAGAKSIIMSLSKVSDEVTIQLMENFYKYWLQSSNKREAFSKAKKELMKTYPNPKYWGSFIMIGL